MTMNEIDLLRAKADSATEHLRARVEARDRAIATRDSLSACIASTLTEIVLAASAVDASETAVALAETTKEEAETAVIAALHEWWTQGCRPPNEVEEALDALIEAATVGPDGLRKGDVEQIRGGVLMLIQHAFQTTPPLTITLYKERTL